MTLLVRCLGRRREGKRNAVRGSIRSRIRHPRSSGHLGGRDVCPDRASASTSAVATIQRGIGSLKCRPGTDRTSGLQTVSSWA